MRRFERADDGTMVAVADADERALLESLVTQVGGLVMEGGDVASDPALLRLLPDAYPDDAEGSAEFRRLTAAGLLQRKSDNARTVLRTLEAASDSGEVRLDAQEAGAWLRVLTDVRLIVATRLGIDTEDDDAGRDVDPMMRDVYDWLGFIQNSLVEALDSPAGGVDA
ncbi:uncharacterized protein DUF2017 [Homoserinimonas aerilata]|uniref:Uncharacterized protein DUF2017 n=1 Tax=Homoserinimonas aerilata TaxID=1162970 RepID=A0A542YHX6_9MICO|nr:DUF2017 domain-containing protein [Homoserinimonas aerilata]TQL47696.1 uncharacterized protein DUF2017 [Homoserinimonas aerilata]